MATTKVVSLNGHERLLHEGYVYRLETTNKADSSKRWRCVHQQRGRCTGRAKTDPNGNVISTTAHPDHLPDGSKCDAIELKSKLRATARSTPHKPAAAIIAEHTENTPAENLPMLPGKRAMQREVWKTRSRARVEDAGAGANDASFETLSIPLDLRSIDGEDMLKFDSGAVDGQGRILLFSTTANLRRLETSEWIAGDGTFKVVPTLWTQMWTIHSMVGGFCPPEVYCLLPDKSEATYQRMYDAVCDLLGEYPDNLPPQKAILDFERGALNATREFLDPNGDGGSQVYGCLFHLAQSIQRKVQRLGLSSRYSDLGTGFKMRVKMLLGLAFVRPEEIIQVFNLMLPQFHAVEMDFVAYFHDTYVYDPIFPHEMWSCWGRHEIGATRSNNSVESFHRLFQRSVVQGSKVSLWTLIEGIKTMQRQTNLDAAAIARGDRRTPSRKQATRNQRIANLVSTYEDNGDALALCRGIAHAYDFD